MKREKLEKTRLKNRGREKRALLKNVQQELEKKLSKEEKTEQPKGRKTVGIGGQSSQKDARRGDIVIEKTGKSING